MRNTLYMKTIKLRKTILEAALEAFANKTINKTEKWPAKTKTSVQRLNKNSKRKRKEYKELKTEVITVVSENKRRTHKLVPISKEEY